MSDYAASATPAAPTATSTQALSPERLAEIRDLLKYESSIAFYSHRAKESMLLLVAEAEEAARLRAQLAELLAERHRTNEALSDAAEQLRADRDQIAALEAVQQDGTPIPARWDRTVIHPEHPEALGLLLVDPNGDTEEAAR